MTNTQTPAHYHACAQYPGEEGHAVDVTPFMLHEEALRVTTYANERARENFRTRVPMFYVSSECYCSEGVDAR